VIKLKNTFEIAILICFVGLVPISSNALAQIEQKIGCKAGEDESFENAYAAVLVAQDDCNTNLCPRLCPSGSSHLYTGGNYDTESPPYTWSVTCVCGRR
jgi:hypothetical protein